MERRRGLLQIQAGAAEEKPLQTVSDLFEFAEEVGIDIDEYKMAWAESLSIPLPNGTCAIAIDPSKIISTADAKAKLAHEMGHCCTGSFYNKYAACDVRQKHENRANRWAIQKLIPEEELDDAVANGCTDIFSLAEHFEVTEDFMRMAVCWYTHGNLAVDLHF